MKVAITGAGGVLGKHFLDATKKLRPDWEILPLTRKDADLADLSNTLRVIKAFKPDVILHAAAMTAVDECEKQPKKAERDNVTATSNVVDAAVAVNARLIYISTDYVFDGKKEEPYKESDKANPINVYGETKLAGGRLVAKVAGSLTVRVSWLYGLTGNSFISTILRLAKEGKTLNVVDDQTGAPTYAGHLAEGLIGLIDSPLTGIVNLSASGNTSWYRFAQSIIKEAGLDVEITPITSEEYGAAAARPANSMLDCELYEWAAGKSMPHWKEGMKEYLRCLDTL